MLNFKSFIDAHKDKKIIILGLGDSKENFINHPDSASFTTIGVNDIDRWYHPDYLVCLDSCYRFTEERQAAIKKTKAKAFFSHLNWPINRPEILCPIEYHDRGNINLNTPNRLPKSWMSPFVAACVAYHMGAKEIFCYGVDLTTNHALVGQIRAIQEDWRKLAYAMEKKGVGLYTGNGNSAALKYLSYKEFTQ